jgi:hypothetical protein
MKVWPSQMRVGSHAAGGVRVVVRQPPLLADELPLLELFEPPHPHPHPAADEPPHEQRPVLAVSIGVMPRAAVSL